MSILKRLFGGGSADTSHPVEAAPAAEVTHEGYTIRATPMEESGQYRLCGTISKEINGETRSHKLIRADVFSSRDQAADATVRKAKQVIAEQGDGLLS